MKILISTLVVFATLVNAQTIKITKQQQHDLGVKIQKVKSVEDISFGPYNGVVVLDNKDIISVSSNVQSVIKEIFVRNYQRVSKGQKLLSIGSNELLNLQKNYIQAIIDNENINENYTRDIKLKADGIISHKKLSISKKDKENSDLSVRLSASYLLSSGLSKSMLKKIEQTHVPIMKVNFLAPRSGVISEINVNTGKVINSDTSMIKMYADSKRFIEITLPLKIIKNISIGDICTFSNYTAKVTTVGSIVNRNSQSVQVRAIIMNSKNIMINRIYAVQIFKKITHAVKIAKSSLVYEGSQAYVFKEVETGFQAIKVKIISEGLNCYIVDCDLVDSDKVAVSSTSALLGAMESGDE